VIWIGLVLEEAWRAERYLKVKEEGSDGDEAGVEDPCHSRNV